MEKYNRIKSKKKNNELTALIYSLTLILTFSLFFMTKTTAINTAGSITLSVGEDYRSGEQLTIFASVLNNTGVVINVSTFINVTITHWNETNFKTDLNNVAMNVTTRNGRYYYNWQIPVGADSGTYGILVKGDPNGVITQASSGFHVSEYVKEINYIWERFKRTNTSSIIHNESIIAATLSSTLNVSLWYNITVPLKESFNTSDYLPVRWKFWFIDTVTNSCIDQSRKQRFIEPYCNPLITQVIGLGNSSIEVNVTIRPSLSIGNYSIVREIEVDPQQIWVSYGKGHVGSIEVTRSSIGDDPFVDSVVLEKKEDSVAIKEEEPTTEECIQVVVPTSTTTTALEDKINIIGKATKRTDDNLIVPYIIVLPILFVSIAVYFIMEGWLEKK